MSQTKYAHRMIKNMSTQDMYEAGFRVKPPAYDLIRIYSPHAFVGTSGRNRRELDEMTPNKNGKSDTVKVLAKFYNRFPMLKLMPQTFYAKMDFGMNTPFGIKHPASNFINKYKKFLKQGFSEDKAFEMVEVELRDVLEEQRDQMRLLRGAALSEHGHSYLDRAQKVAELESSLKMQRYVRDIPKFERTVNAQNWLDEATAEHDSDGEDVRDSIEDLLYTKLPGGRKEIYEPVLYKLVKDKD